MSATFDRLRERFEASPGDDRRFAALEEHLFLQGEWRELVAAYWLRLGASSPNERPADRARLVLRLGQVFEERCQQPDLALPCYREAARLDPELRPALQKLRRLLEQAERWDEVLPLLEREVASPLRASEALPLRLDAGWISLRHGLDPARALHHFDQALATQPASRDARFGRAEALEALGERDAALATWQELREGASAAERTRIDAAVTRLLQLLPDATDACETPEVAVDERATPSAAPPAPEAQADGHEDEIEIDEDAPAEIEIEVDAVEAPVAGATARSVGVAEADTTSRHDDASAAALPADDESLAPEERLAAAARELTFVSDRKRQLELLEVLARGHEGAGRDELALGYARKLADRTLRVDAYETCARLHARLGQPLGELEVLAELDSLVMDAAKLRVRRRRAEILTGLQRESAAIEAWRAALEVDAEDADSWLALATLHASAGRWAESAEARRRVADLLPEVERAEALFAVATLQAERVGDRAAAIATLAQAVDLPGAPPAALARLEVWLEEAERFEELASRLALRRDGLADGTPESLELDLRRAELLRLRLGRAAEAVPILARLQRAFPNDARVLDAWEHALRQIGDVEELEGALAVRAERESGATREAIQLERALILGDRLGRVSDARAVLDALAGTEDPERARAVSDARIRFLERDGDFAGLRAALEARVAATPAPPPDEARALHERLARLCRDRLGDPAGAIRHLEASLALDPSQPGLWRSLALLRADGPDPGAWLAALEGEIGAGVDPERARELHASAATFCLERLHDAARAEPHWRRVLALDPAHATAAEFLIARYEQEGRHADLVGVLEGRLSLLENAAPADRSANARTRTSLRVRIAGLRARRLGDVTGAIEVLEPALDEHGPRPAVAEPLAALYADAGLHAARVDLCRSAADAAAAGPERAAWRQRLAESLLAAGREDEAAAAFRAVLDDRRDDVETLSRLIALHRRRGDAAELAATLERALLRASGAEEVAHRLELAALLQGPLSRRDEAMRHLRRVLELAPGHPAALERALEIARLEGCEPELLPALEAAIAHARSEARRAELWTRQAEILAGPCARPGDAVVCLRRADAAEPGRPERRAALLAALEAAQDWPGLMDALRLAYGDSPPPGRAALVARAAEIAESRLGPAEALPWLERLCAGRPDDPDALARRTAALRRLDAPDALLASLDAELRLADLPERRLALELERARLFETRLHRPALAVEALASARGIAPHDPAVLRELVRLHERLGDLRSAAARLEDLAPLLAGAERGAAWRRLAGWRSSVLDEPAAAIATLRRALDDCAASGEPRAPLLQELGALLRASGDLDAWARVAEEELALLSPSADVFAERRHSLRTELASAWAGPLAAPDRALAHLRELSDAAPPLDLDGPARARFELERRDAEERLLALLRAERASGELADRLAARVARDPDDTAAWRELAVLRMDALHDAAGAAEAWRELLAREPGDVAGWRALRACAERRGDFETVAASLDAELAALAQAEDGDARTRAALLRRLGDVAWGRLGSTTRASRAFAAALEAEPGDRISLHALERLLEAMEDWKGALELYERELTLLAPEDVARRREVWLAIADIAEQRLADAEASLDALEAAVALGDAPRALRARLADALLALGRDARFADVYATVCDDPEEPGSAAEELALSDVLARLGRVEEALGRALRASERDPGHAAAWDAVARLRLASGARAEAGAALERAATLRGGAEGCARLVFAAALASDEPRLSLARLERATELDTGSPLAFARLARVALRLGRHDAAATAACRAFDLDPSAIAFVGPERLETALAGAEGARESGARSSALRLYAAALDLAPEHADAAASLGELELALGDAANARRHLELWLRHGAPAEPAPRRAARLALLGESAAAMGDDAVALVRFDEALLLVPGEERAHAGRAGVLERAGRSRDAAEAFLGWSGIAVEPSRRATCLVRAAELLARDRGAPADREAHLRAALDSDACHVGAWTALAELLAEASRFPEVLEAVELALDLSPPDEIAARLLWLRGVAHEARGEQRDAARAYGEAAARDSHAVEAALATARLLRGLGEWRAAADRLQEFAARQDELDRAGLARVLLQLARLRAGPLEDVHGAIDAYERALAAQPDAREAHEALAELLTHIPARWDEARRRHRELLELRPTRAGSIRSLLRIARGRAAEDAAANGLALLRALGVASPEERDVAPDRLRLAVAHEPSLEQVVWERVRLAFREIANELGEALGGSGVDERPAEAPRARFRELALRAEGELCAPALVPLDAAALREVALVVAGLVHERDAVVGDGALVNRLASAIGWRARRRLSRRLSDTSPEEIADIDFHGWREELRALAHASALDASGGELRGALVALLEDARRASAPRLEDGVDLCALVDATPAAAALLRRVVLAWADSV